MSVSSFSSGNSRAAYRHSAAALRQPPASGDRVAASAIHRRVSIRIAPTTSAEPIHGTSRRRMNCDARSPHRASVPDLDSSAW